MSFVILALAVFDTATKPLVENVNSAKTLLISPAVISESKTISDLNLTLSKSRFLTKIDDLIVEPSGLI